MSSRSDMDELEHQRDRVDLTIQFTHQVDAGLDEDTSVEVRATDLPLCIDLPFADDDDSNTEIWSASRSLEPFEARSSSLPPLAPTSVLARDRGVSWLALGALCFALGAVLAVRTRGEPVAVVRRLPAGAAFHEPPALLTSGQPEAGLQSYRPSAPKRTAAVLHASPARPTKHIKHGKRKH